MRDILGDDAHGTSAECEEESIRGASTDFEDIIRLGGTSAENAILASPRRMECAAKHLAALRHVMAMGAAMDIVAAERCRQA
jgi:hypothetical protein